MQPVKINCPHCGHPMEYWTKDEAIACTNCKGVIAVEPCTEPLDDEMSEEDATDI